MVIGFYSQKVREKLIQEGSELTLEKAVDIARIQEMSNIQLQGMTPEDQNINSLRKRRRIQIPKKQTKSKEWSKHEMIEVPAAIVD